MIMSDDEDNVLDFAEAKRKLDLKLVDLAAEKSLRERVSFTENANIEVGDRVEKDSRVAKAFAKYGSNKGRQHRKNKR
jgi:hypothetical protein